MELAGGVWGLSCLLLLENASTRPWRPGGYSDFGGNPVAVLAPSSCPQAVSQEGTLWAGPCPTERVLGVSSKFIFWPRFFPWQRTEAGWGCGRAGSCGRAAVLAGRARGGPLNDRERRDLGEGTWGLSTDLQNCLMSKKTEWNELGNLQRKS